MPIHRERYRRREGGVDLRGGAWAVIAANGLRIARAEARVPVPDDPRRGFPWSSAACRSGPRRMCRACRRSACSPSRRRCSAISSTSRSRWSFSSPSMSGSGLIADDIRANALQLYLSRPITRTQYIAGKAAILMARAGRRHLRARDAAAPARAGVRGQHDVPPGQLFRCSRRFRRIPSIQITLSAFLMLALSSLSKSRWFVAMLYAGPGVLHACRLRRRWAPPCPARHFRGCRSSRTSARSGTCSSVCRRATTRHPLISATRDCAHHRRLGGRSAPAHPRDRGGHMTTDADRAEGEAGADGKARLKSCAPRTCRSGTAR